MVQKMVIGVVVLCTVLGALAAQPVQRTAASGGFTYASVPTEAALYLNDIVYVRDSVQLPVGDVRVLLPPGTFPSTVTVQDGGTRVAQYRLSPISPDVYYSQAAPQNAGSLSGGRAYSLTWEGAGGEDGIRDVQLSYLMTGGFWTPSYDMSIVSDEAVELAFYAEIQTTTLLLDEATVYLVAGRVDLSQQVSQVSRVTMNQYLVGYEDTTIELPALGVGSVDLRHVYPAGVITALPGDIVYQQVAAEQLSARRLHVWNAASDSEVSVIYKVLNDTEVPLAEGIVRNYQDGLFIGSDFIETTPIGSEGSVTVGSLPDVRVKRTASEEYRNESGDDFRQHSVTLEAGNFGESALALTILDRWDENAWQFEFGDGPQPAREPDNVLRWEVTVPAGESLSIAYQYRTEY